MLLSSASPSGWQKSGRASGATKTALALREAKTNKTQSGDTEKEIFIFRD